MATQNECARTDTVFLPISEVCDGTVSLGKIPDRAAHNTTAEQDTAAATA